MAVEYYPRDGSERWLDKVDADLASAVLRLIREQFADAPRVAEIGVWKGAWASVVLMDDVTSRVVGVDPYPHNAEARTIALDRMRTLGVDQRFTLVPTLDDIDSSSRFHMVHVDGEHSERQALIDLRFAHRHLEPGGMIVVDDYRDLWFPGVSSALYRFCAEADFRLVMATRKAYIAHADHSAEWYRRLHALLSTEPEVTAYRSRSEFDPRFRPAPLRGLAGEPFLVCMPTSVIRSAPGGVVRRLAIALTPPALERIAYRVDDVLRRGRIRWASRSRRRTGRH